MPTLNLVSVRISAPAAVLQFLFGFAGRRWRERGVNPVQTV
jgi:hypothetical protein